MTAPPRRRTTRPTIRPTAGPERQMTVPPIAHRLIPISPMEQADHRASTQIRQDCHDSPGVFCVGVLLVPLGFGPGLGTGLARVADIVTGYPPDELRRFRRAGGA